MNRRITTIISLVFVLSFSCCTTTNEGKDTIMRGSGTILGTVTASAAITENRATGEVSGDTQNYGYIIDAAPKSESDARKKIDAATTPIMEKARANAIYEIITQVRKLGGNAVTEVVSQTFKDYDPDTRIETVRVTVVASAVKTSKKGRD